MCGRFNVSNKISPKVSELFNTRFSVESNNDLCPSQGVSTLISGDLGFYQMNALWGIKPKWSKKLIINAQSETVGSKPTFRQAFQYQRCLVPCNGWYEWRNEAGKKVKYLFEHADKVPLYMAGILFQHEQIELVTLTTKPNNTCAPYHKRMPAFILPENKDYWFNSSSNEVESLLQPLGDDIVQVSKS